MVRKKKRASNPRKNIALTAKEIESSSSPNKISKSHTSKMETVKEIKIKQEENLDANEEKLKQPITIIKNDIRFEDLQTFSKNIAWKYPSKNSLEILKVWRRPGERYNSLHTALRHTARTAGVMVWGAIAYDSRSTLIVMRGTLTGQRYVDDIIRPHVGPFLNGLPGAIFQQDNARPHTARVAQDFLRHFQTLPWPAHSTDLSPVEHVQDQLIRQMPSCHSVHDLELVLQDLWAHLPQDNVRCLINSMPDRVAACISAGGGPTRY
ncbi:transposable element Tcb2 transposase [Trichonephila clavipes]|nr:transposable element Tcb2 transposase [Trichonephila clavipes]